jgi:hypothetical protein
MTKNIIENENDLVEWLHKCVIHLQSDTIAVLSSSSRQVSSDNDREPCWSIWSFIGDPTRANKSSRHPRSSDPFSKNTNDRRNKRDKYSSSTSFSLNPYRVWNKFEKDNLQEVDYYNFYLQHNISLIEDNRFEILSNKEFVFIKTNRSKHQYRTYISKEWGK